VRDNLETLYGAVDDGALTVALPKFVRAELEDFLTCGQLCWGLVRLRCEDCRDGRVVAFACKGRGFCPSCLGRRMCSTAANLVECVLPPSAPLRQWVLTFPFAWRKRLGYDAELLGALTQRFVKTVLHFYAKRMAKEGAAGGKSGAIAVVQRTSSDLKLNPHLHVIFLDGVFTEKGDDVLFHALARLSTRDVADVLARAVRRITKYLTRRGFLDEEGSGALADDDDDVGGLEASAVSGNTPPAGPEIRRGTPLSWRQVPVSFDRPLCVAQDGFTLHAATRAGAMDPKGREALLKYVLRPPISQEHVVPGPDGLVRITLKRPFRDGTTAVDMDPLSLLSRLAASVPAPRFHTVRYMGVLAPASKLRSRIVPVSPPEDSTEPSHTQEPGSGDPPASAGGSRYRPWAELLKRAWEIDVLSCPRCQGRMKLVAMVTDPKSVARYLRSIGEPTHLPQRAPARGPPYWKSRVMRHRDDHTAA